MKLYETICCQLREAISKRSLKPGDRIYSVEEMKAKFRVSHITALRVYRELSESGLIEFRRGQGYFVCGECSPGCRPLGCLGCIVRSLRPMKTLDNFFNEINVGIQSAAANRGIDLLLPHNSRLLNTCPPSPVMLEELKRDIDHLAERVDGFLFDERIPDSCIAEVMARVKKPVVVVNRLSELPVNTICQDNALAIQMILELGRRMNYSRFVFCSVCAPENYASFPFNAVERDREFRKYLTEDRFEIVPNGLFGSQEQFFADLEETVMRCLDKERTLLIGGTDSLAYSLLDHFSRDGRLPENLGVAGLEGLARENSMESRLAAVRIDREEFGEQAVDLLLAAISRSPDCPPRNRRIAPGIVLGKSMN